MLLLEDFFGEDFFVLLLLAAAFFFVAICITPFQFWKRQKSRHRYYRLLRPFVIKKIPEFFIFLAARFFSLREENFSKMLRQNFFDTIRR